MTLNWRAGLSCHPSLPAILLFAGLALGMCQACTRAPEPKAVPVGLGLPSYSPEAAVVFDDTFALGVFEATAQSTPPGENAKLAERAQQADSVVRVRVSTVTRDSSVGSVSYNVVFAPLGPPLAGDPQTTPVTISVGAKSPAFQFVSALDAELVAKTLVLFFRRYNDGGQVALHWRAEPDTWEVREAVDRAAKRTPTR